MYLSAELSRKRFVPTSSKTISRSASPPPGVMFVMMPWPKMVCLIVSPFLNLEFGICPPACRAGDSPARLSGRVLGAECGLAGIAVGLPADIRLE